MAECTSPKNGRFRIVKSIETPDAATVIFHLSEPNGGFLNDICRPGGRHRARGRGQRCRRASCRHGAVSVRQRAAGRQRGAGAQRRIFRNACRDRAGLRFRVVPEAIVRALELSKGSADLEESSLAPDMIPVLRKQSALDVTTEAGTNYAYVAFNFDDPVVARREVRQALAYATDRAEIIRYLYRGQARLADAPLPPNSWAYEPNVTHFPIRSAAAEQAAGRRGISAAGGEWGMRMKLALKTSTDETTGCWAPFCRNSGASVGVDLALRSMEPATLASEMTRGDFELYTLRWVGGKTTPTSSNSSSTRSGCRRWAEIAATIATWRSTRCLTRRA